MVIGAALVGLLLWLRSRGLPHWAGNAPVGLTTRATPAAPAKGSTAVLVSSAGASAVPNTPGPAWRPCRSLGDGQVFVGSGDPILLKVDRMEPGAMELTYAIPAPLLAASAVAATASVWRAPPIFNGRPATIARWPPLEV